MRQAIVRGATIVTPDCRRWGPEGATAFKILTCETGCPMAGLVDDVGLRAARHGAKAALPA